MDGSETVCLGAPLGAAFRAYARPDLRVVDELRRIETELVLADRAPDAARQAWRAAVRERTGWYTLEACALAVGQDACFAPGLARRFGTVGGILAGLKQAVQEHTRAAQRA